MYAFNSNATTTDNVLQSREAPILKKENLLTTDSVLYIWSLRGGPATPHSDRRMTNAHNLLTYQPFIYLKANTVRTSNTSCYDYDQEYLKKN